MAQTAPPLPGEGMPRPLPRGTGRPLRSRDTRPRFQPLDAVWMALLAALFASLTFPEWGRQQPHGVACLFVSMGTVILTYLLGWRASGRPAGVIAGLLLATSGTFATAAFHSLTPDLFALVSVSALFAFIAGSSLAALALAAAAAWLRPDGIVLGLMLLTFTLVQHRTRAWTGAVLFLVPTILAVIYGLSGTHGGPPPVALGFHTGLWGWLAAPATLFASWFLLPFFGEMADPVRRARWLPLVLWTALSLLLASVLGIGHTPDASAALTPFLPLWFLLIGAGLARLLPVMTGDLPVPALRYVVATLAVLSLVAIRARTEFAHSQDVSQPKAAPVSPAPLEVRAVAPRTAMPPASALAPLLTPKTKPYPRKMVVTHRPNTLLQPVKTLQAKPKTVKPPVRLYVVKNGRLVRRSKWAIQWDLTHPHP